MKPGSASALTSTATTTDMQWQGVALNELSDEQLDAAEAYMINAVEKTRDHYQLMVDGYRALGLERQRRLGDEILPRRPDNRTLN